MSKISFHEYLDNQIAICGKPQKVISEELGYDKPNIITMFKQGKTKVPLDKIVPFAKAIGCDPIFLLEKAMTEYEPDRWSAIVKIVGHAITDDEFEMVKKIRNASKSDDPHISTRYCERIYGDMVLIPMAADGTFFHPGLKRRRGYQIGSKENEYYISTYEDALKRLKTMAPKPFWRRPNANGVPGIVAGVRWKKIPQNELERLTTQAQG